MIKRKNKQAMIHITLHRKRKIEQHEPHYKYGKIPVLRKGKHVPLVTPVVLLLLQIR
jgi:hypothetical protein